MENLLVMKIIYKLCTEYKYFILFFTMVISFYPFFIISKNLFLSVLKKLVKVEDHFYSKLFHKHQLYYQLTKVFSVFYILFWENIFNKFELMTTLTTKIKDILVMPCIVCIITSLILTFINLTADLYETRGLNKGIAITLHTQILRVVVVVCGVLTIFSLSAGISIASLFTSIGAATALLTLLFKDTILGLIISLQITFQNIIQIGDWVTMPQYNADGDIVKITITVVEIHNFDGTYTTVPTSAFLTSGVRNCRPMSKIKRTRIKWTISLDIKTITICNQEELDSIRKLPCMNYFAKENELLFNKNNQVTNISMFRYYIEEYLKNTKNIKQDSLTFLTRTMDPTPSEIIIEIYTVTRDNELVNYKEIQVNTFDHFLTILPLFKLKSFKSLTNI